jgi:hypothetical protein
MENASQSAPPSKTKARIAHAIAGIVILFLLFDSVIHILAITPVVESFNQLGYPAHLSPGLGIFELICLIMYVIPRTSVLGTILLTGYLGGAVAVQLRAGAPLLSTALFPVYVGVVLWGALYMRDSRLRTLVPLRQGKYE